RAAARCVWLDRGRRADPASAGEPAMTPVYQSIGVLVLGAVVLLLLVSRLSGQPRAAGLVGLPFAIVAAGLGLQAPQPLSLAVVALSVVGGLALLLVPVLQPEVPAHV